MTIFLSGDTLLLEIFFLLVMVFCFLSTFDLRRAFSSCCFSVSFYSASAASSSYFLRLASYAVYRAVNLSIFLAALLAMKKAATPIFLFFFCAASS